MPEFRIGPPRTARVIPVNSETDPGPVEGETNNFLAGLQGGLVGLGRSLQFPSEPQIPAGATLRNPTEGVKLNTFVNMAKDYVQNARFAEELTSADYLYAEPDEIAETMISNYQNWVQERAQALGLNDFAELSETALERDQVLETLAMSAVDVGQRAARAGQLSAMKNYVATTVESIVYPGASTLLQAEEIAEKHVDTTIRGREGLFGTGQEDALRESAVNLAHKAMIEGASSDLDIDKSENLLISISKNYHRLNDENKGLFRRSIDLMGERRGSEVAVGQVSADPNMSLQDKLKKIADDTATLQSLLPTLKKFGSPRATSSYASNLAAGVSDSLKFQRSVENIKLYDKGTLISGGAGDVIAMESEKLDYLTNLHPILSNGSISYDDKRRPFFEHLWKYKASQSPKLISYARSLPIEDMAGLIQYFKSGALVEEDNPKVRHPSDPGFVQTLNALEDLLGEENIERVDMFLATRPFMTGDENFSKGDRASALLSERFSAFGEKKVRDRIDSFAGKSTDDKEFAFRSSVLSQLRSEFNPVTYGYLGGKLDWTPHVKLFAKPVDIEPDMLDDAVELTKTYIAAGRANPVAAAARHMRRVYAQSAINDGKLTKYAPELMYNDPENNWIGEDWDTFLAQLSVSSGQGRAFLNRGNTRAQPFNHPDHGWTYLAVDRETGEPWSWGKLEGKEGKRQEIGDPRLVGVGQAALWLPDRGTSPWGLEQKRISNPKWRTKGAVKGSENKLAEMAEVLTPTGEAEAEQIMDEYQASGNTLEAIEKIRRLNTRERARLGDNWDVEAYTAAVKLGGNVTAMAAYATDFLMGGDGFEWAENQKEIERQAEWFRDQILHTKKEIGFTPTDLVMKFWMDSSPDRTYTEKNPVTISLAPTQSRGGVRVMGGGEIIYDFFESARQGDDDYSRAITNRALEVKKLYKDQDYLESKLDEAIESGDREEQSNLLLDLEENSILIAQERRKVRPSRIPEVNSFEEVRAAKRVQSEVGGDQSKIVAEIQEMSERAFNARGSRSRTFREAAEELLERIEEQGMTRDNFLLLKNLQTQFNSLEFPEG